jgi:hypothetical protein
MTRKVNRVRYYLDSRGVKNLPPDEITAILRGADDLIASGGRTLLSKLLKGSKEKKILELELDKNPSYGFFSSVPLLEILAKIDWLIENRYLSIEYDYRLPLLVYAPKGWEIEKDTYSSELLEVLNRMLDSGTGLFNMTFLKDRNRDLIFLLLDKIKATNDKKYIPLLEAWKAIDFKKVQAVIQHVINHLSKE